MVNKSHCRLLGHLLKVLLGFFYYYNDTQETDIEIVTYEPDQVYFTNQPVHYGSPSTVSAPSPADLTDNYHEYRLDWIEGQTLYYIDGVLVGNLTDNVPSIPGQWMWNNWRYSIPQICNCRVPANTH